MLVFDALNYPYPSARTCTYAKRGMVATTHPLAAQAGLSMLQKGGNAIDAAVAAAAALTVVEPTSNGIGGDCFAILWSGGKLHGLNSSGKSPKSISIDKVKKLGYEEMPKLGFLPVTVPGIPGGWAELNAKFGKLRLDECLAPAVNYAGNGHPVAPIVCKFWQYAYNAYKRDEDGSTFDAWFNTFAPMGRAPFIGEMWASKDHANTLEEIGATNAESFYRGRLAKQISSFFAKNGGFITEEDMADFSPEWVNPISTNYRGVDVWEIPPNSQGLVALIALNILKGYYFERRDCADTYHKQFEAMKLAFTLGKAAITDSLHMKYSTNELLCDDFADELRSRIGSEAIEPALYVPNSGGTVYLAAADDAGNMISFIQSNYMGFGSGVVVPGTGIALQNRGADFSLDPTHVNALAGGKKTYHTIIPGFLTKNGVPVGPFGVMGGYMQPQGHVQAIMNTIDFAHNPQAALDAPRWQWIKGRQFEVESSFPSHIVDELRAKGHEITAKSDNASFGRGQIIWRDENDVLIGGTEHRADGAVVGF